MNLLIGFLGIAVVLNLLLFLVAYRLRSDKLTDISYALTFIILAGIAFSLSSQSLYHVLLLVMVGVWAVRIGGFLLYRVVKKGKDRRFDGMREDFLRFGKFWLVQGVTVWVVLLAALWGFQSESELNWLMAVGGGVWALGLLIESAADFQKYAFSQDRSNKGKWIESGVWKYSRHPNYFGEILVWVGVYIVAAQSLDALQSLVALVSPLFIAILLLFISGVPILEKSADKKWGSLPAYQRYKRRTSLIVPLPRGR